MSVAVELPHHGVLTRLGVSAIHGIGVFAIAAIAARENPFRNDNRDICWVDVAAVERLPPGSPERALYRDFGIRRGKLIGCPQTFDLLGTGWYVNEPPDGSEPNMIATSEFDMIANRDIEPGEELTVIYKTFSDAQ